MCQRCSEVFGCRLEMFGGLWRCSWLFHPPIAEAAVPPPYRRQGPEEATGILQACTVACGQEPSMEVAWHKGPTLMSSAAQYLLFLARVYALFSPLSMDHCIALEMVREIARCEIVPTRNPPPPPPCT